MKSIKITNENFHIIGEKIQKIIDITFGKSDEGYVKFNFSRSKYNKNGCSQTLILNLPTTQCGLYYGLKDIYYSGGFYKGYYRLRGVEIFNFRVSIKQESNGYGDKLPLEVDVLDSLSDELNKMKQFIDKMNQLTNEIQDLDTVDSMYNSLVKADNFILPN